MFILEKLYKISNCDLNDIIRYKKEKKVTRKFYFGNFSVKHYTAHLYFPESVILSFRIFDTYTRILLNESGK